MNERTLYSLHLALNFSPSPAHVWKIPCCNFAGTRCRPRPAGRGGAGCRGEERRGEGGIVIEADEVQNAPVSSHLSSFLSSPPPVVLLLLSSRASPTSLCPLCRRTSLASFPSRNNFPAFGWRASSGNGASPVERFMKQTYWTTARDSINGVVCLLLV